MVESQNWTNDFKSSFRNLKDLYLFLDRPLTPSLEEVAKAYPVFIPAALATKIKNENGSGPLSKEFLPHNLELDTDLNKSGFNDPIGDEAYLKAPQLIHRYHNRALFTPTTICPVHCRYCFRKNELNSNEELFQQDFEKTISYLKAHPEISEIIFTGGDPLTLSNEKLEKYFEAFTAISSIKDIRLHTRYPVIMPSRIDDGLVTLIEKYSSMIRTFSIGIHANHPDEFDDEASLAIEKLKNSKAQLLSQTVLLKGVNDSSDTLIELMELFLNHGVRPYYLHHPDRVKGGMHFYTSLQAGRALYSTLRNALPGWALPHYVIDIPGGHGKVSAYNPETTTFSGQLLSKDGEIIRLQEPDLFV